MFERNVYDVFGLYCESRFSVGKYEGFHAEGQSYIILPKEESMLSEREMIAYTEYMRSVGDVSVLEPILTLQKKRSGLIDGQYVYVCKLPDETELNQMRVHHENGVGTHLAMVHSYGKQMPSEKKGYEFFGQWHKLWEKRLEQLESWYEQILYAPQTVIDEAFLFSFPYYIGLTENAIQYAVDAMIDDPGSTQDEPTICHYRFTDKTWLVVSEGGDIVKRPTEFVYDHPCRDLAEWIRHQVFNESIYSWEEIQTFLTEYERYEPLSTYAWRLLYARLLFPLHYFETIERYYRSQIQEEKNEAGHVFLQLLKEEHRNEQFLKAFSDQILQSKGVSKRIPSVDWL